MTLIRLVGALLLLGGCGGFGLTMVGHYRREIAMLRQLISLLQEMEWELKYRLTPLPELLQQAAKQISGIASRVIGSLSTELANQISPDVSCCMEAVLSMETDVPTDIREVLTALGKSMGRFDLEGQIKELDCVEQLCRKKLAELENNRDVRLRSYQTLGLCAGAAIAILLL